MQKLLCASASLNHLLTKFLTRLNSLYVSQCQDFFPFVNRECFCAIKCFNYVNQGLELEAINDH